MLHGNPVFPGIVSYCRNLSDVPVGFVRAGKTAKNDPLGGFRRNLCGNLSKEHGVEMIFLHAVGTYETLQ